MALYTSYFTDTHQQVRLTARKFVDQHIHPFINDWEEAGTFPRELYNLAGEAGLLGIDHLRTLKADLVWCNARESAKAFYGKEGFLPEGAQFDIEGIGVHQLMLLRL